jgi:hypothetical protein
MAIPENPTVKKEDLLPIDQRPPMKRDQTQIVVNGEVLDRKEIAPIRSTGSVPPISPVKKMGSVPSESIIGGRRRFIPSIMQQPTMVDAVNTTKAVVDETLVAGRQEVKIVQETKKPIEQVRPVRPEVPSQALVSKAPEEGQLCCPPLIPVAAVPPTNMVPSSLSLVLNSKFPPVPSYAGLDEVEKARYRAIFKTKYGSLRELWPTYEIPDPPEGTSLEIIHAQYDVYRQHFFARRSANRYKLALTFIWLIIEYFLYKMGLDVQGYTLAQARSMFRYEEYLIKMGESSNEQQAEASSSPEYDIIYLAVLNAGAFAAIKFLTTKMPESMASQIVDGMISYMSGTNSSATATNSTPTNPTPAITSATAAASTVAATVAKEPPKLGGEDLPATKETGLFSSFLNPSTVATYGSAFISGQKGATTPQSVTVNPTVNSNTTTMPKFSPAFVD